MRRKDRQIVDPEKIRQIVDRCTCCRLGFHDDGEVYIVPLSFGYEITDGLYTLYFHGAKEGRKIGLIEKNPNVGFEMDANYEVYGGPEACDFTARFQSVIGNGTVSMVTDPEEKIHGLNRIMEHYAGRPEWKYAEKMLSAVAVFKLEVTSLSCKEHE